MSWIPGNCAAVLYCTPPLPAEELDRFSRWFEEFLAEQWDRQFEADILAGRLNSAGRRADEELEAGRCTPLSP